MTSRVLNKSEWHSYFDKIATAVRGKQSHIEVVGPALGDQVLVESAPMLGIAYEPEKELLEIAIKGLDHLVQSPQRITVEEDGNVLSSFEVIDRDGMQQIVTLRPAIRL